MGFLLGKDWAAKGQGVHAQPAPAIERAPSPAVERDTPESHSCLHLDALLWLVFPWHLV
jgi:hypothetical protein